MKLLVLLGIVVIVAGVLLMSGCKEETLNGKNVREVFSDPNVQALAVAAAKGDVSTINKLVNAGADVNATGFEGARPLVWAWGHNNLNGMEALLKAGAETNFDFSNLRFINHTLKDESTEFFDLLLRYGAEDFGTIHYAINLRKHGHIKSFIKQGGDINYASSFGSTPLMHCLSVRNMELATWLIEKGANLNIMNTAGGTAAWIIQDGFDSETYSPEAAEKAKVIKQMLIDRGVKWPPLSPEENRKKFGLPDPE